MEFTVTKEFVREAHSAACLIWKQRIEKEFPDLFKTELVVGKWYKFKFNTGLELMSMITEIKSKIIYWVGFRDNIWRDSDWSDINIINQMSLFTEATQEEVESALIAEAKKRGYKKGVTCIFGTAKEKRQLKTDDFIYENQRLMVKVTDHYDIIFKHGKWAEILPEQKTIITKGKALRIIAKKLKVSPESIEIQ